VVLGQPLKTKETHMTRTFNDASFEGTERITDELIASFGDDWYPDE